MWGLCKQRHSREGAEGAGQSVEVMRHGGLQRDIMCSCGGEGGAVCVEGEFSDTQGSSLCRGVHYPEEHNISLDREPPSCQGQAPGP